MVQKIVPRLLMTGFVAFISSLSLMGDMLTTVGSAVDEDFKMLDRLGYEY
mgnify:CR=1 FL=1